MPSTSQILYSTVQQTIAKSFISRTSSRDLPVRNQDVDKHFEVRTGSYPGSGPRWRIRRQPARGESNRAQGARCPHS